MKGTSLILVAVGLIAPSAIADTIQLSGVLRDFKIDHPDMQRNGPGYPVVHNMVLDDLGVDNKPVLDAAGDLYAFRVESEASFNQWFRDVPGVNITLPLGITLDNGQSEPGGVYSFAMEKPQYFFPLDGMGWNDMQTVWTGTHNFYFTYEIHTEFVYTDPATRDLDGDGVAGEGDDDALVFSFTGDDDVWVFINGKLAVDIGGVHGQASDEVNLDQQAAALGLIPGEIYPLDFFFAERHTTESNFRIETTIQLSVVPPTTVSPLYD